ELVQHDDAGAGAERVDDPAVRLGIVTDVVERDIGPRCPPEAAGAGDLDLDVLAQLGHEEGAVVGDPGARSRSRRVVRHPHDKSLAIVSSHETRSASAFPATPHAFASSGWTRSHEHASAMSAARGSQTSPVRRSATTSSGPPASLVVITGFSA